MGRRLGLRLLSVLIFTSLAWAQTGEIGVGIGFGFYHDVSITTPAGEARAGFGPRFALTAAGAFNTSEHLTVEGRYAYQDGDLELKSGLLQANLDGEAHSLLGELLVHFASRQAKLRPFAAAGLGVKIYRGTEVPVQARPLGQFATLQTASEARPLLTFGGGVKYALSDHWLLRLDLGDYATPFPSGVITPAPGARVGGWLHDFVPMLSIARSF